MRKKMLTTVIIVIVFWCSHYVFAGEPIGHVTSLKGEVSVIHTGEQEKNNLELNDPVYIGDTIQTAPRSKVQILMEDDSLLNLGEKAQITISKHMYQPEEDLRSSIYKLIRGKLRVVVGKIFSAADSSLEVETPTSIIGIRMTEFIVWVVSPELTVVITLDGEIVAKNIRPDLICAETVAKGYESQIAKDVCPTAPAKSPIEKMEEILLETEAYIFPPVKEMPFSTASLNDSVQNVLTTAPVAGILGTGMIGAATTLKGGTILGPLTEEAHNIQLLNIQAGEVASTFAVPAAATISLSVISIVPVVPLLLPLPKPPEPPH
jgi:hypothetical protein